MHRIAIAAFLLLGKSLVGPSEAGFCIRTFKDGKFSSNNDCEGTANVANIMGELLAQVEAKKQVTSKPITTTLPATTHSVKKNASEVVTNIMVGQRSRLSEISLTLTKFVEYRVSPQPVSLLVAVDVDPIDDMIYWTSGHGTIQRAKFNNSEVKTLVTNVSSECDGIAVDWIARNLYWTDKNRSKIEVSKLDGSGRLTLINEDVLFPRAIAVDPVEGYMYWSDWGIRKIERNYLNGENREVLVNTSIIWPNGLTVDYERQYLYWVDSYLDKIEAIILQLGTRHLISAFSQHVFGFSYHNDFIYWTNWQNRTIDRMWLLNFDVRQNIASGASDFMDIKAYGDEPATGNNPCGENNGGCAGNQLCFYKPTNTTECR